jgi:hypothetical protein
VSDQDRITELEAKVDRLREVLASLAVETGNRGIAESLQATEEDR